MALDESLNTVGLAARLKQTGGQTDAARHGYPGAADTDALMCRRGVSGCVSHTIELPMIITTTSKWLHRAHTRLTCSKWREAEGGWGESSAVQPHLLLRYITPEQRGPQAHWSPKIQGPADHMGSPKTSPRGRAL